MIHQIPELMFDEYYLFIYHLQQQEEETPVQYVIIYKLQLLL